MPTYARHQFSVQDREGNVLRGAEITVQQELAGFPLATLYLDRDGVSPAGNPIYSDDDGFVYFHAAGGQYKITIRSANYTRIMRYVQVGVATGASPGLTQTFDTPTTDADPGAGKFRLNNATLSSVTAIYLDNLDVGGADVSAYLDTLDDTGALTNRGTLELRSASSLNSYGVFRVTGSVVNGTGYRKLTVEYLAGGGTLVGDYVFSFSRAGTPGDTSGPAGATSGNITTFADATGKALADSGKALSTDGTLASNSDAKVPTEKAVKTYVDALLDAANAMQFKGTIDCSANPNYPAASAGHIYVVSVAGKIGGASGPDVEAGDWAICKTDSTSSGNHATVGAQWGIVQFNIAGTVKLAGVEEWFIPASNFAPRTSNGCATLATLETTTNKVNLPYLAFDGTTQEFAQTIIPRMPKSWNEGTITAIPVWAHPSTTVNFGVVWGVSALALTDDDAADTAFGTAQTSTDTGGTTSDVYHGPATSAITVGNSPSEGDSVVLQVSRNPADGSDTMAVDAYFLGLLIRVTSNAANDA